MLGSIDTFKKFKAGDGTNVMCSQNKFDTDYTKILQLRPSVEKLLVKCSVVDSSFRSKMVDDILKSVKKKSKSKDKFLTAQAKVSNTALRKSISKTTITKHSLLTACMSQGFDSLLNGYQRNISKIKIKREQLDFEWSLFVDQSPEDIRSMVAEYVRAFEDIKIQAESDKQWTKPDGKHANETRVSCPYPSCNNMLDIRIKESGRWKYFKHHVLCRHMQLEICQCNFCGVFIKQNSQNVKANPRLTMFVHNMIKHLPYDFRKWPCSMCNKRYLDAWALRQHVKYEHSGNEFVCFVCPSNVYSVYTAVNSKAGLNGHLNIQHGIVSTTRNPSLSKNRTREMTTITYESKKNDLKAKGILKACGMKLDTEYPEQKFAMTYNQNLSALLDFRNVKNEELDGEKVPDDVLLDSYIHVPDVIETVF
jgi:hypothetical protein